MRFKIIVASLAIAIVPVCAQAQQSSNRNQPNASSGPKPTVTDVQRVVGMITADKAKVQLYCDVIKIDDQIAEAEQSKNTQKAEDLSKQADQIVKKIGPEYTKLMEDVQQVDPSSPDGKKLVAAFEPLDKLCMTKQ